MTLFQMEVLIAIMNTGNFTRAGEQIGLSQSGVSHTIRSLEKELGISLFIRERGGVRLTATGEQIAASARIVLNQVSQMKRIAAEANGGSLSGTIRIGAFPSVSVQMLPRLLKALHGSYPELDTRLFEGSYQEIKEWLRTGVVDVGFLPWPDDELEGVLLLHDPLLAVLPVGHSLAAAKELALSQLAAEPFIMPMAGCEALIGSAFAAANLTPNVAYEVADNATILAMVEADVGVTVVPALTLPEPLSSIAARELSPPLKREIGVAVRSLRDASPAVHAFIQLAQRFSTLS
ncbi:LysR family transcriptional regulator [Brevibacillus agri]|uniref:LysR family transcriptional regulator n=1 Tax=Brevibacillus agri TaxID=51101 RepID=A0A3M8B8U3_9BACL|nr:LysR family transcriptional regulator [Brevibacillus agri]QAV16124.1 transcriptional regulator [Brevibacillus agri]RNB59856.1 LysR family transcriptional regulator [Brevibacillus agri]GED25879.1 LysR family transcriptional regulator [Brevibacillus agri]